MSQEVIRYDRGVDGIVTLTLDLPGLSANVMNAEYRNAMASVIERLQSERDDIGGVIVTSGKSTFFAGGDLVELSRVTSENAAEFAAGLDVVKAQLRSLETLGRPVVACIAGSALGSGWEIALACHHRLCLDDDGIRLGMPEVSLGLLPGAGGVTRTIRLLGLTEGLPMLLEGSRLRPREALQKGLVHALATDVETMLEAARTWIRDNPEAAQPWDQKGYRLPGGAPNEPRTAQMLPVLSAKLRQKTRGTMPAPEKILCAAVEGAQVDLTTAFRIETRYLTELACGQVAKNMINTFWFQLNEVRAGKSRPRYFDRYTTRRVGVIGAGMMGAGIAHVSALAGIDVVLKDVSEEAAAKGRLQVAALLEREVDRGLMSAERCDDILASIRTTDSEADFEGCDLIIEAVYEDRELKKQVTAAAEAAALPNAVIASNTSTLPITGLARAVSDPERFIGLHFFSPVQRMSLVEIICGRNTGDATLARAFDYVLQIGKTPIVVNDSRGFYTSRVFGAYANEGIAMLAEGVPAALIENEARKAGMPVGPLAVSDEVSLGLMLHIRRQMERDLAADGKIMPEHPADAVVQEMVEQAGRSGRAAGGGFYDYPADGPKRLWPELKTRYQSPAAAAVTAEDVRDRLLFVQALETVRCLEEGVVMSVADANVGSLFGWGYAPWTGGTLQFLNQMGLPRAVERVRELAKSYGPRFEPPELLTNKAERAGAF